MKTARKKRKKKKKSRALKTVQTFDSLVAAVSQSRTQARWKPATRNTRIIYDSKNPYIYDICMSLTI